jgi:hypothetical protein
VSGIPSNAPFYDHLGRYSAEAIASCLHELSLRVPRADSFAQLCAERISELVVQCEDDLHPYTDDYPHTADTLVASGAALRPFVAPLLGAPGTPRRGSAISTETGRSGYLGQALHRKRPCFIPICTRTEPETPNPATRCGPLPV